MANVNGTYHKLQYLERKPHQPKPQVYMRVPYPGRIGIWRCWFLLREKNRRTRRKALGARQEPTANSTHIWHRTGIEPGPNWWEASALTTTPTL